MLKRAKQPIDTPDRMGIVSSDAPRDQEAHHEDSSVHPRGSRVGTSVGGQLHRSPSGELADVAGWLRRLISYSFVGGFAAVVNLACFGWLYYHVSLPTGTDLPSYKSIRYVMVFAIAAEISTMTNFVINDRVTFSKLPGHARRWYVRCARFHLTALTGTLITLAISYTLVSVGVLALLAEAGGIGVAFTCNFLLHHVYTYRRLRHHPKQSQAAGTHPGGQSGIEPVAQVAQVVAAGRSSAPGNRVAIQQSHGFEGSGGKDVMKLSIVIPAHNEEDGIRPTVHKLAATLETERIPYEILVVNDHSTDGTESVLADLVRELPAVRYVNNPKPGGFGYAIRTGLEEFSGDAVCIVMADASDDPKDVVAYYRRLEEGYECVFGSRFARGSRVVDYPLHKLLINRLANRFVKSLFRLRLNDTTNAFKCYRREVIEGIQPVLSAHFNITVELPLKAITRGYTYATVPINWYNRTSGVSKLKIKEMGSRYLFIVLYVWLEQKLSRGDYLRRTVAQPIAKPEPVAVASLIGSGSE